MDLLAGFPIVAAQRNVGKPSLDRFYQQAGLRGGPGWVNQPWRKVAFALRAGCTPGSTCEVPITASQLSSLKPTQAGFPLHLLAGSLSPAESEAAAKPTPDRRTQAPTGLGCLSYASEVHVCLLSGRPVGTLWSA